MAFPMVACTGGSPGWREGGLANAEEFGHGRSAAAAYLVGRHALEIGRIEEAARNFERAARADPYNVELRRQAFLLLLASGDFERARQHARELVELETGVDEARLLLAVSEAAAGRFQAAREQLARLGGRGPLGAVAPLLRAWARAGTGDLDAALELLERGGRDDPLGLLRTYHRALVSARAGRTDQARELLAGLVRPEESLPLRPLMALLALDVAAGERERALARLAEHRKRAGDQPALAELEAQIRSGGQIWQPVRDPAEGMADALLGLAQLLREQRMGAQALAFARLAGFLAPEAGDVWLTVGRIRRDQGDHEAAVEAFRRVGENSLFYLEAQVAMAEALRDQGRAEEATRLLRSLAQSRPERIEPLVTLGDLMRRDERWAEAIEAYTEAIRRLGEPQRPHWRLFYVRGIAFERAKRWPEAEADFLRALDLQPDQPFVLNYLGYSWVDQGVNLERAKAMLHRAVELRSQDGYIVDSLGWAYFKLGDYQKAVEYLERAVELEPGDPTINDHLGDAYWRVGRFREARFQWQRALGLGPEKDAIAAINEKLEKGLPEPDARRG
ncbi:MAG: tetratricopeptide repeat protein [Geminicoccaceae bacterium]|nr:tetratricopeptide repeat protein [Geminicoccaceae bacterium]